MTTCPQCKCEFHASNGRINAAAKINAPIFCGKSCAGMARRNPNKLTGGDAKKAKREYDAKRRATEIEKIKAGKKAYYIANRDRLKKEHAEYRAKNMHRHVAYCQQPEYVAWKAEYDRQYRAKKVFGEFAGSFLLLQDVETEISSRATRYEIHQLNGTLNKSLQRKRSL